MPFANLYGLLTDFRNYLYESGKKPVIEFDRYIISVGNLTAGGTGKTPLVEMLIRELKPFRHIAILSRGYRRKTTGFRLAGPADNATTIGDEPLQYYMKYGSEVSVAVGEERVMAIPELLLNHESIDLIILDDAYQHRKVHRDYNILLCDFNRPFYEDRVIPAGLLREKPKHANRADAVIVTKCQATISRESMSKIKDNIHRYTRPGIPVYFSSVRYLAPVSMSGKAVFSNNIYLFTAIANAVPLEEYISEHYHLLGSRHFADHHFFTKQDITELLDVFDRYTSPDKCLLTTEKDMVRLRALDDTRLNHLPLFYLPIELYFVEKADLFIADLLERINRAMVTDKQEGGS